jgi:hypothetical protein
MAHSSEGSMPQTLADLTGAPLENALPDHVLSPPSLADYGKAEREFCRQYGAMVADFIKPLPPALQEKIALKAAADVHNGSMLFGTALFRSWALSANGLHVLAWLSLQVKHPQLSLSQATILVSAHNNDGIVARLVWDLWGYRSWSAAKEAGSAKYVNWGAIFHRLTGPIKAGGLGFTHEQASALTMPQLLNLLGGDVGRPVTRGEIAASAAAAADAVFDRICATRGLGAEQIGTMTPDQLIALVREEIGDQPIDAAQVMAAAKGYRRPKSGG